MRRSFQLRCSPSTTEPDRFDRTDISDVNTQAFAALHGIGEPFDNAGACIGTMSNARLLCTFAAAVESLKHVGIPKCFHQSTEGDYRFPGSVKRQLRLRQRVCPQLLTLWKNAPWLPSASADLKDDLLDDINRGQGSTLSTRTAHASVRQPCWAHLFVTGEALMLACLQSCSSCVHISTNWFTCHSAIQCEKCAKRDHTQHFTSTHIAALTVHSCFCRNNRTILRDAHTCLLVVLHRRQASSFCACIL